MDVQGGAQLPVLDERTGDRGAGVDRFERRRDVPRIRPRILAHVADHQRLALAKEPRNFGSEDLQVVSAFARRDGAVGPIALGPNIAAGRVDLAIAHPVRAEESAALGLGAGDDLQRVRESAKPVAQREEEPVATTAEYRSSRLVALVEDSDDLPLFAA